MAGHSCITGICPWPWPVHSTISTSPSHVPVVLLTALQSLIYGSNVCGGASSGCGSIAVERATLSPETERVKDEWDTAVFEHHGPLRFTALSQLWLRESAKVWAYDWLPTHRGNATGSQCAVRIGFLALLSESLRLQRPHDHGNDLKLLSRNDMLAFLNRLTFLQTDGVISLDAAGGDDCPVRFRCVGCAHFSTDVSYLPDLEAYLADLLRSRERLRSAFSATDDWPRPKQCPRTRRSPASGA
ncbi:hypothetical protein [Nocardia sp. BMG51109]|uniref:hypothetical protein n=1 Tax=Nocardia sp. BMG51109 TaxID=1056816 RepID=UPI0004B7BA88|nr:hypothetical protein [Nocardia sp. BMG51109]